MTKLTLAPFGLESSHAFLDILLSAREHRVYQSRELMRGRLHRPSRIEPSKTSAMAGADEAAIVARGARGHTQRLSYRVDALHRRPLQHLSPADTRPRRQVQPRTKMLARRKTRQVSTKLRKDRQRRLSPQSLEWPPSRRPGPCAPSVAGHALGSDAWAPPSHPSALSSSSPRPLSVSTICSSAARI